MVPSPNGMILRSSLIARPRKSPPRRSISSQLGLARRSLEWNGLSRFLSRLLRELGHRARLAANHRRPGSLSGPPILIFVVVLQRCARIAAALASRHHLNGFEVIREGRAVVSN